MFSSFHGRCGSARDSPEIYVRLQCPKRDYAQQFPRKMVWKVLLKVVGATAVEAVLFLGESQVSHGRVRVFVVV